MAQFELSWVAPLDNGNPIDQTAYYRRRSVGGAYISTGFTPNNNLAKDAISVISPVLLNNNVYQFKVECNCTENGPSINDNGIVEKIEFQCINPTLDKSETTASIVLNVSGTDIVKARITLRKLSDNSVIVTPTVVLASGNEIEYIASGLTAGTSYYWQVELIAVINDLDVISSGPEYLASFCSPYAFTTDVPDNCDPILSLVVDSIEIV